ncbi:B3 domain-containing protein [Raphanus sativus]|uniref:B3 domain-containing protein At3g17010 n=1 Tax=Raphanus sativus TaxID=3726 RepID=A0A6J0NZF9_RAPSA|nr:B3 domain-containing protein At3g17010 [Raphanus sativus]XP_056855620.1 B3 domain-containing protein At3g17010-like [Raphanus sativus]XP_056866841.1 B3 domain-containing protein At3g17010-like [Raphanus sativus]KAJ4871511.1 B3 domain-containing protein [Raphanus sativus]
MVWNRGFGQVKEERKTLSFFKIFQSADLSSESMRAFPYDFMMNVSKEDFSNKMVIRAQWGGSWEVDISKNPRFYYMEKSGWNQFVTDNALGANEFVTFTHKGLMCFDVNIYRKNGKEILVPQKPHTTTPFSGIKKEEGERSYKDVKNEDESMGGGVELAAEAKTAKTKKNAVEIGESSRGAALRNKKAEKIKKKKAVPKFKITIKKSYLKILGIPKNFYEEYIKNGSMVYKIRHPEGEGSWEVLCLGRKTQTIFSSGWSQLAREYPLSIGDRCTFRLIKPTEFVLTSRKAKEEIIVID